MWIMNPMYLYQYDAIVYMFEYWWWTLQILLNNSTIYRVGAGGLNSTTATQTLEDNGQLLHVLTGAPFDVEAAVLKNCTPVDTRRPIDRSEKW